MAWYSAFPRMPTDTGRTIGSGGSAGFAPNTIEIKGLMESLQRYGQASPVFRKEIRKASYEIAKKLSAAVKVEAGTTAGTPGRARQYLQVAKGLRANNFIVPEIKLRGNEPFRSTTRPVNKNDRKKIKGRKQKVVLSDIFFGAEFGGGATSKTKQFLRHRGQSGYFFWPTVRKRKNEIATEYLESLDRIIKELNIG